MLEKDIPQDCSMAIAIIDYRLDAKTHGDGFQSFESAIWLICLILRRNMQMKWLLMLVRKFLMNVAEFWQVMTRG